MKFRLIVFLGILLNGCVSSSKLSSNHKDAEFYLKDEVRPALQQHCFLGAYYRKVVSSRDYWKGIEGEVILPFMEFDESRKNSQKIGQYLDNPSVYMGGDMDGQETDIGLTWEVIKYEDGSVSQQRLAFRPFFRRAAHSSGQMSLWHYAPAQKEYYWYPGEKVYMSVEIIEDKKLRMVISGEGKYYEEVFDCEGYKLNEIGRFKRVNAIDQVRNEGKDVQPTRTIVKGAHWLYTNLFRDLEGVRVRLPMHKGRYTDMRCPDQAYFDIRQEKEEMRKGGEKIEIRGMIN